MKLWWLCLLLLTACSKPATDGVTELVYATPYAPSHPFSRADQTWMDFVAQQSQGTLKIVPNWSGALISSENSMTELRHGVADIGLITPIYVKGKLIDGFPKNGLAVEVHYGSAQPSGRAFNIYFSDTLKLGYGYKQESAYQNNHYRKFYKRKTLFIFH